MSVDSAITRLTWLTQRRPNDVFCAQNVGVDAFERIVFCSRNLLQRGGMNNVIDVAHRHFQPRKIAYVTDEETQPRQYLGRKRLLHLVLLEFIARKDDEPLEFDNLRRALDEGLAE